MYDQFDDRSRRILYGINKVIDLPEFVKEAAEADEDERDSLPSNCFADPANRKYAVHTKAAAYLSRLYFTKNASMYTSKEMRQSVKENLDKAAKFWELDDKYTLIEKKQEQGEEIPVVDYAGNKIASIPLNTPRDFEKAAIQIFENAGLFTYPQRRQAARTLLGSKFAKEAKLSDEVAENLQRAAGYGMTTKDHVLDILEKRASAYGRRSTEFSEKMMETAAKVMEAKLTPKSLDKVATVIDVCDHQLGLRRFYGKAPGFDAPEKQLFEYTEKLCSEVKDGFITLHNGAVIDKASLEEKKLDQFFDQHLGEIPQAPYSEKLAILSSLPSPDADALVQFVSK